VAKQTQWSKHNGISRMQATCQASFSNSVRGHKKPPETAFDMTPGDDPKGACHGWRAQKTGHRCPVSDDA
jgi:hypothetical protein